MLSGERRRFDIAPTYLRFQRMLHIKTPTPASHPTYERTLLKIEEEENLLEYIIAASSPPPWVRLSLLLNI